MSFEAYNGPNYLSWYQHSEVNNIPILLLSDTFRPHQSLTVNTVWALNPSVRLLWSSSEETVTGKCLRWVSWPWGAAPAPPPHSSWSHQHRLLLLRLWRRLSGDEGGRMKEEGGRRKEGERRRTKERKGPCHWAFTCVGRQAIYFAWIIHLSSQQPCEINAIIISLLWDEGGQGASERLRDTFGLQVAGSCHTCRFVSSHALKLLG